MPTTKTPITVRMDPALLEQVRISAARDNRTVTNYIETALRRHLEINTQSGPRHQGSARHTVAGRR